MYKSEKFEEHEARFKKNRQNQLNDALISACEHGDLETVEILLTSTNLDMNSDILAHKGSRRNYNLKTPLSAACKNGHLNIVKYLITSPNLKNHADLEQFNYYAVFEACLYGHVDIIEYFLTSPKLSNKPDVHIIDYNGDNNTLLDIACTRARLDIVKFLLNSPKLEEHPNIHAEQDHGFIMAATYNTDEHRDLVKYLIFDYKIEKTQYIQNFLKKNPDEEIEQWFMLCELNHDLNTDLKSNIPKTKLLKI